MELLRQHLKMSPFDVGSVELNNDFDSLRDRKDYQDILAEAQNK